ncbi:MAG TPA: SCO1664 family protein [Actinocrinis sp.]|nr:SCO1664 family protein [Actinocrinis sp.]
MSDLLRDGTLTVRGRLTEASNATLYCEATDPVEAGPADGAVDAAAVAAAQEDLLADLLEDDADDEDFDEDSDDEDEDEDEDDGYSDTVPKVEGLACVYKPIAGERPLWDFPDGTLAAREFAAYTVSEALGWDLVPRTVLRDGPYGPGMCQQWVDVDEAAEQFLAVLPNRDADRSGWCGIIEVGLAGGGSGVLAHRDSPALRRIALFDLVINNADRKGGHVLPGPGGALYAIDHGVSFHVEDKVRTLLWGFAGREFTAAESESLRRLRADPALAGRLGELLAEEELAAFHARLDDLLAQARFPGPDGRARPIPWPPV